MTSILKILSNLHSKTNEFSSLDQCHINDLYSMLHFLITVFKKYKINYTIIAGTLLGAIRPLEYNQIGSIIESDDDIDLSIFEEDEEILKLLKPLFNKYGYNFVYYMGNYKFYKLHSQKICPKYLIFEYCLPFRFPFIDIFVYKKNKFKFEFNNLIPKHMFPQEYFNINNLFPLKEYKFGPLIVTGPNNPYPYLDRTYGSDWKTIRRQNLNHQNLSISNKEEKITEIITVLPTFTIINNFTI